MSLLVYICGPYSSPTEEERERNVAEAIRAGYEVLRRGHYPLIPHLSHHVDRWHERAFGERLDPERYMQWDFVMLRRCDGLLFLGPSPGANRELALARELGMPVFTSVNQIPADCETT